MRAVRRIVASFAFGVLATTSLVAQGAPRALEDSARALLASRSVPGGQVVILLDGHVVADVAYGLAQVDSALPVTSDTRFRIGSISKLFTATAAALLWESGRLSLDAPTARLVPEFVLADSAVTARRVAGHIAGVRHYAPRDFTRPPQRFDDVIAPLAIFAADTLVAPAGSRYLYSSYGYNLLGAVVQRASGEEFRAHMVRAVFAPVGMAHTVAERSDSSIAMLSAGYNATPAGPGLAPRTDLSDRWPSGGYLSTALDVARFGARSVHGPWLSARVRALLFTPMQLPDGTPTGVGFGWRVGADSAGRVIYHHGGASIGGRAMLVVWRDQPLVVAITTNLSAARISEADAIALGLHALRGR
jgi:serine beta-lactamase-like protein LACTB